MFFPLLFVAALVLARDLPEVIKAKEWLTLALMLIFTGGGLSLALLIEIKEDLPSVAGVLIAIIDKVFPFIRDFLVY